MDILTTLKKLRYVESDPQYRARSRRVLLAITPPRPRREIFWGWIAGNIESGASLAMAGLCLFLIFAGFSLWKSFSPLGINRLDLAALRAEAQAIDIQIQLAGLEYQGSTQPIVLPPLPKPASEATAKKIEISPVLLPGSIRENQSVVPEGKTSSTAPLSLDEALLELSE